MDNNDIDLENISEKSKKNESKLDNPNKNYNPIFCPICNQNLTGFSDIVDILFYFTFSILFFFLHHHHHHHYYLHYITVLF